MNIIILCADEYRADMLAANGRNPDIRTPHLDRLAEQGVNFQNHFTSFPKCVPARISMMTGRYPHTDGYRTITQHMPVGTADLASHLQARDYQLIELGLNHCWENMIEATGDPQSGVPGMVFDQHAWKPGPMLDIWKQYEAEATSASVQAIDPPNLADGLGFVKNDNLASWWKDEAITAQACHFLKEMRDPSRPFFLWVNIGKPHPDYNVGEPWFSMYDRNTIMPFPAELPSNAPLSLTAQRAVRTGYDAPEGLFRAIQATYMGMCSRVDGLMGKIIDCIDSQGLFDSSLVMFLSDHGDFAGQYGLPEKWDTTFADGLVQVPCVMACPDLPRGTSVDCLTSHVDLAPTICNLAGAGAFDGWHGVSMLPTIDGQPIRSAVFAEGGHEAAMRRRFNFCEKSGRQIPTTPPITGKLNSGDGKQETYRRYPESMARARMVRTDRWKYVHRETGDHELYDLKANRWELTNLYGQAPSIQPILAEMRALLLDWTLATDTDRPHQGTVGA